MTLWVPPQYQRRNTQLAKAIVFLYAKKIDWIILPADPRMELPGYERIECRHAHEVEKWSAKLRSQEQRMKELNDEERYNVEEPLRSYGEAELVKALQTATTEANKKFLARSIENIRKKREQARKEYVDSYMHVEGYEQGAEKDVKVGVLGPVK